MPSDLQLDLARHFLEGQSHCRRPEGPQEWPASPGKVLKSLLRQLLSFRWVDFVREKKCCGFFNRKRIEFGECELGYSVCFWGVVWVGFMWMGNSFACCNGHVGVVKACLCSGDG